jgi:hypothetical protein
MVDLDEVMGKRVTFDYERFLKLSGSDLVEYIEPLIYDSGVAVPGEVIERLIADLDSFDEYHLVYSLEFGTRRNPKTFAPLIPPYLAHKDQSVRFAAEGLLRRLPESCLTAGVADAVRTALASCPESDRMPELAAIVGNRVTAG